MLLFLLIQRGYRTDQAFYLAAGPHFYRRARVWNLSVLLYGTANSFPSDLLSDTELLSIGNTKLPLLGDTEHLHLVSGPSLPRDQMVSASSTVRALQEMTVEAQT